MKLIGGDQTFACLFSLCLLLLIIIFIDYYYYYYCYTLPTYLLTAFKRRICAKNNTRGIDTYRRRSTLGKVEVFARRFTFQGKQHARKEGTPFRLNFPQIKHLSPGRCQWNPFILLQPGYRIIIFSRDRFQEAYALSLLRPLCHS